MTIRKTSHLARRGFIYAVALATLSGCSSIGSVLEGDRVDYKSAGKAPSLEVPPDLTQLQRDNRYAIPEANRGVATASGYNQQSARPLTGSPVVAPNSISDARIERAGSQRWLVVKRPPEALWPQIKDFWQESGFLINLESPEAGLMETDWAENRAKIPQDFIRRTLGKALDTLYSTGERDKFRTRLERTADGSTEVYISHRGAQEVLVGRENDGTVWTPRPADPELEAEFLSRLMAHLGADSSRVQASVSTAPSLPARAKLMKDGNGGYVQVNESFDRAWRRVGLALDRVGFTVEDRDRSEGLYFVRYIDQEQDAQSKAASEKGFLSKLFTFGSDKDQSKSAQQYRVAVKGNGDVSHVAVLDTNGQTESSRTAEKILSLLNEQLK